MHKARVLVADDDVQIASGVKLRLSAAGYSTLAACNGKEAVEIALEEHPDAIVMDVRMPIIDGIEALQTMLSDERTADIPVVMLSASLRDRRCAIEAGARFFLTKPYQYSSLLAALDTVLARRDRATRLTPPVTRKPRGARV